jgi:hypothetical protein
MQFADVENITGLALINTRFGFNPLTDIWHSMLLASDAGLFGIYLLNDVLLVVLVVFILEMLWESRSRIAVCFVGVFALAFALSGGTINFLDRGMSDFASLVLTSVGYVSLFVMLLQNSRQSGVEIDTVLRAFLTGAIATIMACLVKMNAAPLVVFFLVWWLANVMKGRFLKSGLALAGSALLISTLWLYTNFLISGCLIYPAIYTCEGTSNPSAVDLNAVRYESMVTIAHARAPVMEPPLEFIRLGNGPDWYLAWWDMNKGSVFTWSIIFGSTFALLVCLLKILRIFRFSRDFGTGSSARDRQIEDVFCLIGLALLLHTAYWWLLAPSPRYAMYLPLIWLAFGVTVIAVVLANKVQDSGNTLLLRPAFKPAVARWLPVVGVFTLGLLLFDSDALLERPPAVPEAQTVTWTSPAGLNVNLAYPGIRCWAAAIPCTNALLYDWGDRIDYSPERGYFLHPWVAAVEP